MSPQFRSQLGKDWSERRRLFWSCVGILVYYLGYCLAYEFEYRTRAFVASIYASNLFYAFFGSVLLSMSTVCGEYARRTLKFTASLPIPLPQVAWSHLLVTWFCLVGPIVIMSLLTTVILYSGLVDQVVPRAPTVAGRSMADYLPARVSVSPWAGTVFLWTTTAIASCLAIYLSTIMCLLGTWCRREATVGFLGVIVILMSLMTTELRFHFERSGQWFISEWVGAVCPESLAINWGYGDIDGSHYTDLEVAPFLSGPLAINFLLSVVLGTWFASRYGRKAEVIRDVAVERRDRRGWPGLSLRLPFFSSGPLGSLIWLNARESIPLCFAGLMIAILMTAIQFIESRGEHPAGAYFVRELPHMTWAIGTIFGAIVAVGVFGSETKVEGEEFWRSKPISPRAWFWLKFLVGLTVLLLTFDFIPTIGLWLFRPEENNSFGSIGVGLTASICCTPLLHAQVFAFTAAAICRLRHTIAAAIVGLILFYATEQFMESLPVYPQLSATNVLNKLSMAEKEHKPIDLLSSGYPLVYGTIAVMILVATAVAKNTIVRVYGLRFGIAVVVGLGLCRAVHADGPPSPILREVADGIEKLEASFHGLHLRLNTEKQQVQSLDPIKVRPGTEHLVKEPAVDRLIYDCYEQGSQIAWKSFDPGGQLQSHMVFDGARQYSDFRGGMASVQSRGQAAPHGFPHPVPLLLKNRYLRENQSLPELLKTRQPESVTEREVAGERMIDLHWLETSLPQPVKTASGITTQWTLGYDLRLSVNASRQYWPVEIIASFSTHEDGRIESRTETRATGWFESNSVVFPQVVEKIAFQSSHDSNSSPKPTPPLIRNHFEKCELLELDVNPNLPANTFSPPFQPGAPYYDLDDQQYHQLDASGNVTPYVPKPKGIQGAVFVYLLVSIVVVAIYFLRPRPAVKIA